MMRTYAEPENVTIALVIGASKFGQKINKPIIVPSNAGLSETQLETAINVS